MRKINRRDYLDLWLIYLNLKNMEEKLLVNENQMRESYIHLSHRDDISDDTLFKVNNAIDDGAKGIVVLINYKLLKAENLKQLEKQIIDITNLLHLNGCLIKLIIESELLNFDEFKSAFEICSTANVDFVKFHQIN